MWWQIFRHEFGHHALANRYIGLESEDGQWQEAYYQWCPICHDWIPIEPRIIRRPSATAKREGDE